MSDADNNLPLVNDPAREATASMRGYASQIWRSVLIWIRLQDADRMYLEGAEDIDLIHGSAAETTQVKATAGNITLRSPDVVEAINNAWLNQERNLDREIRYRFLSIASVGMEQGDPLGLGMSGLALWERARLSTEEDARLSDTCRLKQFLLDERRVSAPVQAFLREADASAVWQRLISRVEWDTDAAEAPQVIQEIKDQLVIWGHSRRVPAAEAEKVAAPLYERAWSVATMQERDRFLGLADAIRVFDEQTQVSVPHATVADHATVAALFSVLAQTSALRDLAGISPVSVIGQTSFIGRPPALSTRHFSRSAVIGDISTRVAKSAGIVLHGGTGTGKSTLAAEYVAGASIPWGWVDLRGVEPAALLHRLTTVAGELGRDEGIARLVLDDFDIPGDPRSLEPPLRSIADILRSRAGKLVITSATALPQRLGLTLGLGTQNNLQVPPFLREEIAAFLMSRGCARETLAAQWAGFIELHTQGHAQLVHARIAALESVGFPQPSIVDLTETPPDVVEARTEARRLLEQLDTAARELVYRLSLSALVMQRRQVLSIATWAPAIAEPGLAFDKLIGPWIETLGKDIYRVSPLIRNAGAEIRGAEWAREAHSSIASGLLRLRTLTPYDASAILFHGVAGQDWDVIAHLSIGTYRADADTWSALAEPAGWFVLVGTGEGVSSPDANPSILFLIRLFQYRLAAAGGNQRAALAIIARFDAELPPNQADELLALCRQLFLGQVLVRREIVLSVTSIINIGVEYITLNDASDLVKSGSRTIPHHALQGADGSYDVASVAGFALSNRIDGRPEMIELLEACEPLPVALARRLLWFIGGTVDVASLLFARSWLWESRQESPDWVAARAVCMRAYSLARKLDLPGLAQAAARAVAQIIDEHLGGRQEACAIADELAAEIGWSPSQEDGRAGILLRNSDFGGALDIWRRILPSWQAQSELDIQRQYSCRDAAIAAGHLNEWQESADWLATARERTGSGANPLYEAALLIDEGYARWKAGDNTAALARLNEGLHSIERLPRDLDDANGQAALLRKRAGHTVMWMAGVAGGSPRGGDSAPTPAWCSRLDPYSGPRLVPTPHDLMWAHLLEFEMAVGLGDDLLRAHEVALGRSPYGLVRVSVGLIRIRHRLKTLALDALVELAFELAEATEICRRYYKEGGLDGAEPLPADAVIPTPLELATDIVFSVMSSGIFALAARGLVTVKTLGNWRVGAEQTGLLPVLGAWLNLAEGLLVTHVVNSQVALRDNSLGWAGTILATIGVCLDDTVGPAKLMTAHVCWINTLPRINSSFFPIDDIEHLVTYAWLRIATNRPFLLRMASITVPELQKACASSAQGWRKIGEILLAAELAIPETVPETMRQTIRKLVA
jgi:hypothetical protein